MAATRSSQLVAEVAFVRSKMLFPLKFPKVHEELEIIWAERQSGVNYVPPLVNQIIETVEVLFEEDGT